MVTQAGLRESAFYEVFRNEDECYLAAFDDGVTRLSRVVADALSGEERWLERIRAGLAALLGFLDDEPQLARLMIVDAPAAGVGPERCRRVFAALLERLNEEPGDASANAGGAHDTALTDELVVGGLLAVIQARIAEPNAGRLAELAPTLLSFIVTPYLGRAAASKALATSQPAVASAVPRAAKRPVRATARTMQVLGAIAAMPLSNNREIAEAAGLADEGQTSKLLNRLEQRGLIENLGLGHVRGEPNAWLLTPYGRRVAAPSGYALATSARATGGAGGAGRVRGDF